MTSWYSFGLLSVVLQLRLLSVIKIFDDNPHKSYVISKSQTKMVDENPIWKDVSLWVKSEKTKCGKLFIV